MNLQGAIMAAVSSSKWLSFYNDPSPPEGASEEVTSAGKSRGVNLTFYKNRNL